MITCRVCEVKSYPFDDAILLCRECRSQAYLLPAQVVMTRQVAIEHSAMVLEHLPLAEMRRAQQAAQAYDVALNTNTLPAWERRAQITIAQGGPLAEYLEAHLKSRRIKAWAKAALEELAAYADEQLEAA